MKVSEMIEKLKTLKEENGDLDVYYVDLDDSSRNELAEFIEVKNKYGDYPCILIA